MGFSEGQRVHVAFDGTIDSLREGWLIVEDHSFGMYHQIWAYGAENLVTPLNPEQWPPRVGDIWEAGGVEFYVRSDSDGRDMFVIESFDVNPEVDIDCYAYYGRDLDEFKALNPRLVRRREV
jgi:hypothetical protein